MAENTGRMPTAEEYEGLIPGYSPIATAGDCRFDGGAASRALQFFPALLTHVKGIKARTPFILHPTQAAVIGTLYGWKRADGTRRYRRMLYTIARKNGKSTLGAGIGLYQLIADGEEGPEVIIAAGDRDQASLIFDVARVMVDRDTKLSRALRTYHTYKSMAFDAVNGILKAISADADTAHGLNASCAIVDEVHNQPNRKLVDVLETSTAARQQPLILYFTTAGYDKESICREIYDYACRVRDGLTEDLAFLPIIYEAAADADWKSPDTWRTANPLMGEAVTEEYLRAECKKAQELPAYENTFRRLHLNQWTEQDVRWIPVEKWDALERIENPEALKGKSCFVGLDLSSTVDITAAHLTFRDGDKWKTLCRFWVPEEKVQERAIRDRVPYDYWVRSGFLYTTPGNVVDYGYVREQVKRWASEYRITNIAVDPWNATQLAIQLNQEDGLPVVQFRQGFASMSAPAKEFEKIIVGGRLAHDHNPVMRWMVSNVMAEQDAAGNLKPSKKKSNERIDGVVALIMALGVGMASPAARPSVYETRGPIVVGR